MKANQLERVFTERATNAKGRNLTLVKSTWGYPKDAGVHELSLAPTGEAQTE